VRTLVESELGGRLAIRPRPGGGTSVQVSLPVKAIAVPSGEPKPGDAESARDSGGSENPAAAGRAAAG